MTEKLIVGHAFNLGNIVEKFPKDTIKVPVKELNEYGFNDKRELVNEMTGYVVQLILDDIIENNTRFNFPTPKQAFLQMEGVYGDEFIKAKKNGAFIDVDPYDSGFTGHNLMFNFKNNKRWLKKHVYVDHRRKKLITDKTNLGFKY